ncbi:hypothetical protein lerEdw1_012752 [Lerista edwardsae]|nr:hypothetical protein lerEdw1_012752 [Lerista edwardsae]
MGRRKRPPGGPRASTPLPSRARDTAGSSAASKRSAAAAGYTADPFAPRLLPAAAGRPRRAPAIHRGYYIRAQAVGHCVREFLLSTRGHPRRQILSLGAGFDSLYFCLKSQGLLGCTVVFEVDFPDVSCHKAALIAGAEELTALTGHSISERELGAVHFAGEDYRLLGADLSELPRLERVLQAADLDPRAPTLLLAEVVLTYMDVERSDALVQWAAKHFSQAWCILYEQIHPGDPFGGVMQRHFHQLNSQLRSLARYPDCEAQRARFLQRPWLVLSARVSSQQGWDRCCAIDLNAFYRGFVSAAEKQRIQALEPFDEFEEWHLKCSHYFILAASKGEELTPTPVFPGMEDKASLACDVPRFAGTLAVEVCAADAGLRRYGHRNVLVAPGVVLTTGGFGDHGGRHGRLTALHALIKREGAWRSGRVGLAKPGEAWGELGVVGWPGCPSPPPSPGRLQSADASLTGGRLFHTVTLLQAGWAIVLGGRQSPLSPVVEVHRLRLGGADGPSTPGCPAVELTRLPLAEDPALRRWRHTATEVAHQGEAYLFVYGGCRGPRQSVLADWRFLHLEDLRCRQIPVEGSAPAGRHSHSACGWAGGVLVAGGLDATEQPLGGILFLRPAEGGFRWHPVATSPPLTPRYSHTAHVHRERLLLLVGGVWLHAPAVPGVAVIDLTTGATVEYRIDTAHLEWPLMLHNHSSIFLPEEEEVLLIGGGGNCFSFGSHFNRQPVRLLLGGLLREP